MKNRVPHRQTVQMAVVIACFVSLGAGQPQPPEWTLTPVPEIKVGLHWRAPSPDERLAIHALIDALADIEDPDYGFAPLMSGSQFAPVEESREFGAGIIMIDHGLETSEALKRLVTLGPHAIPELLRALEDATPTKLVMEHFGGFGAQWYAREISTNRVHPTESAVRENHPEVFERDPQNLLGSEENVNRHVVTIGDIAFTTLGQIVNRGYSAVRYQPTACRVINSPTHDATIARIIREIWESTDPYQALFDSLMIDLHTRGSGSDTLQCGAAMRLLYYYPEESAEIIAERIRAFDFGNPADWDRWQKVYQTNGVRAQDFIEAVRLFDHDAIVDALFEVMQRAEDPQVFVAALNDAVVERDRDLVFARMTEIVSKAPPPRQGPFGGEYYTLIAAAKYVPAESRELWSIYRGHNTLETLRATIHALNNPTEPQQWMIDYLAGLLDDTTDTGWEYGPDYDRQPIRICDEAAKVLANHYLAKTRFDYEETPEFLNQQIAKLTRALAGEEGIDFSRPVEPAMPEDLATIEAVHVLDLDQSLGRLYELSDDETLWISDGYRSENGYAYDTIEMDAKTGEIRQRFRLDEWRRGVTWLRPQHSDLVFSWHKAGGLVVAHDVRTGDEVFRMNTPFRDVFDTNDPSIRVSHMTPMYVTHDQQWLITLTEDCALHSINVETGEHRVEWKYEGEILHPGMAFHSITPLRGTSRFLLPDVPDGFDKPLRMWDQETRTMTEFEKVPMSAWRDGWGDIAWQAVNNWPTIWNLAERVEIEIPRKNDPIVSFECDSDQTTLFVMRADQSVDIFRLVDGVRVEPLATILPPEPDLAARLVLSADDRFLFWLGSPPYRRDEEGKPIEQGDRTVIATFDVADLTTANL